MRRLFGITIAVFFAGILLAGAGGLYVLYRYGQGLPDYKQLADYEPPVMTRVHAGDGRLIAEYARERRLFVPISAMPRRLIEAFLAAEDKNFYSHSGIDLLGIVRASLTNLGNLWSDRRPVGASTVTQQVAKNFLLSNEVSLERKIKEIILAFRIERAFPKDRILELYLNEIYLGFGSYGVAAAALNYFDKSLDELTLPEMAYLAALPKAPNNYHPLREYRAAVDRRNWVLGRMEEDGAITALESAAASAAPLRVERPTAAEFVSAGYFVEEVRRELVDRLGERALYGGGLSVRSTLDPRLQAIAVTALRDGLLAYDRRHGWRGPVARLDVEGAWWSALAEIQVPGALDRWRPALVLEVADEAAEIGFADGGRGRIPLAEAKWARPWIEGQYLGPQVRSVRDVLETGDVVLAEPLGTGTDKVFHALRQVPAVNGGLLALDPHTGRVLAMAGGFRYEASEFNRVTQAMRQPGSAFKPIVYAAALEEGFTPSSIVLDAPFVIDQGPGLGTWKPANYTQEFFGPSTLRLGIEKSRNLMTVRLAQFIGMDHVVDMATRMEVAKDMPPILSMALGAGETTLLKLTTAYAMFVNGGRRITPTLIDRIQDRRGKTIYRHDDRDCPRCIATSWRGQAVPDLPDDRRRVLDAATAYQIVSMLEGVVERGTGVAVKAVGRPLAGKTGTTNDSTDAWFIGFSPDLAAGVYVGFDRPSTLGRRESGSTVAAPVFRDFMKAALEGSPEVPFRVPPSIHLVRVNASTGLPAAPGDRGVILEAFRPGTEPTAQASWVLDGSDLGYGETASPRTGTGGLY